MTDRLQHPVISDAAAFLYIKFYLKGGKMRNITFAIYKGIEYSAGIKKMVELFCGQRMMLWVCRKKRNRGFGNN